MKETTIAAHALGRGPEFGSKPDSAVRVQATRLRNCLQRYYAEEGAEDEIRITLPRGSYIPVFEHVGDATSGPSTDTDGPGVIVGKIVDLDSDGEWTAQSRGIADSLAEALSGFDGLRVYGPVPLTAAEVDSSPAWRAVGAHYLLEGTVRADNDWLRVSARLVDLHSKRLVTTATADRRISEFAGFGAEGDLVTEIAARIADARGELQRDAARSAVIARLPGSYGALLGYYRYMDTSDYDEAERANAAIEEALLREPDSALMLAMLAGLKAVLVQAGRSDDPEKLLAVAEAQARAALQLRPQFAIPHNALARIALLRGDPVACQIHASRAVALQPMNPSVIFTAGYLLLHSGDRDEAITLMRRALRLNPRLPEYSRTFPALDDYLKGDYHSALAEAHDTPHPVVYLGDVVRALAYAKLGAIGAARAALATARAKEPQLEAAIEASLSFPEPVKRVMLEDLAAIDS